MNDERVKPSQEEKKPWLYCSIRWQKPEQSSKSRHAEQSKGTQAEEDGHKHSNEMLGQREESFKSRFQSSEGTATDVQGTYCVIRLSRVILPQRFQSVTKRLPFVSKQMPWGAVKIPSCQASGGTP